ncbi:hypothetical protein J6590_097428 [Homalodisca vitripennis]|nr:hypothetical protein J6590_097428 [Homalodisca vitripennis]
MPVFSKTAIFTSQVLGGFFLTYSSVANGGQEWRFSPSWFIWSSISTAAQATLPYYWIIRIEQELARQCFGRLMENQHMPYIEISQESSNSQKCEVRTLLNIYWLLVDAVHQANAIYCDQLMATTSYLFFSIVVTYTMLS